MPTSNSIKALFSELSSDCGEWAMKIGEPVEVRYSDSLLHVWTIMELMTLYRPAGCSYVEIMGRGGCYSRFFSNDRMIVLGAKSSVPITLYEEVRARSLEIKALKAKETLSSKGVVEISLELF